MSSSIALNGLTDAESRSASSLCYDDSEESFVVLNNCPDEASNISSLQSTNSTIGLPTLQNMPETICQSIVKDKSIENVSSTVNLASNIMITSHESNMSYTSELSAEEIQQKMGSLLRENSELKETLKQNNLAIKQQYEALAQWQEDVVKVQESHKIKFEETKKLVLNLKTENAELKKYANSSNDSSKEQVDLKSKISALEFELDTLRQSNSKHNSGQVKIIQELELKLSESEKAKYEDLIKFKSQIDNLNSQLKAVESEYNKIKEELVQVKTKIPSDIEITHIEIMKQQLKELSDEIVLKNTMLKEKADLIENLHETISKLKIENECIPILKTQVDVYQTDFNQEREAREALKAEKDHIIEDLKHLQRRNQQLLEQVELLQKDDRFVHAQMHGTTSSRSSPTRSTPVREQSPPLQVYSCPICGSQYRNLGQLEEHVEQCLQNTPNM